MLKQGMKRLVGETKVETSFDENSLRAVSFNETDNLKDILVKLISLISWDSNCSFKFEIVCLNNQTNIKIYLLNYLSHFLIWIILTMVSELTISTAVTVVLIVFRVFSISVAWFLDLSSVSFRSL